MKRVIVSVVVLTLAGSLTACNKNESSQPAPVKVEQTKTAPAQMKDGELALAFLTGIQKSDKKLMYEVSNLTSELVEESREKLTNVTKYKQTKNERKETEHALRMSGNIDFFIKKLTKIFPKSAQLQITKTTPETNNAGVSSVHHVKITYLNTEDALLDKKGQKIKEMIVKIQQYKHVVNGHALQEFGFDSKDFEKMADRDFEVLSYF